MLTNAFRVCRKKQCAIASWKDSGPASCKTDAKPSPWFNDFFDSSNDSITHCWLFLESESESEIF